MASDQKELYRHRLPLGDLIPIVVTLTTILDVPPEEGGVQLAMRKLRIGRA